MAKYVGPSRSAMRQARVSKTKVAIPGKGKSKESLTAFKGRVGKMSRDELLKEAEDLLGDDLV